MIALGRGQPDQLAQRLARDALALPLREDAPPRLVGSGPGGRAVTLKHEEVVFGRGLECYLYRLALLLHNDDLAAVLCCTESR